MEQTYKVRKVGGGLVITLPQHIVRFTKLIDGDTVTIIAHKDGKIIVTPTDSQGVRYRRANSQGKA